MEARLQAELLYSLCAISRYMTWSTDSPLTHIHCALLYHLIRLLCCHASGQRIRPCCSGGAFQLTSLSRSLYLMPMYRNGYLFIVTQWHHDIVNLLLPGKLLLIANFSEIPISILYWSRFLKAQRISILLICFLNGNLMNFFHMNRICFSNTNPMENPIVTIAYQTPKSVLCSRGIYPSS